MKNVAIIAAGGSGKRMGAEMPKQYLLLSGKPILLHTLNKFEDALSIDAIILVLPQNDIDYVKKEIVDKQGISKVTDMIAGGKERQDSVRNAIDLIDDDTEIVVIHDGARPFITTELINLSVERALEEGAVALGVPVKDTVKSVNDRGIIRKTLDRDTIWIAQTPQAFQREVICEAYRKAYKNNYSATDDSCLVERLGIEVRMITGSYDNIKITTKDDII
ncbi:MAG TPA: 2-C-methyl-D-erythritol 4-phosphate cytidylyltransferase, partial [Firmicutes bacterium]|nr:2-C-methyl-D-erythritol 4-phosphate cytidylyltransferase [Bacillota bacterium]